MAKYKGLFERIEAIAVNGERCPFNEALPAGGLSALARAGKIRIEVFRHNWRVVTILVGPHAGIKTMQDPYIGPNAKPYVVIDGTSLAPRMKISVQQRQEPWKPVTPKPAHQ